MIFLALTVIVFAVLCALDRHPGRRVNHLEWYARKNRIRQHAEAQRARREAEEWLRQAEERMP